MLYRGKRFKNEEFRKLSSEKRMRTSPTSHFRTPYSRIEDYELKERITRL
jgi:hypothetical protein